MAAADGTSRWISGEAALVRTHQLRAQHDAIMVGIGTILADNPRLTVRHVAGTDPVRIVVDRQLRTPLTAAVIADGAATHTWLVCDAHAPQAQQQTLLAHGATLIPHPLGTDGTFAMQSVLHQLGVRGIRSVMLEGGSRLIASMVRARCVDRIAVTIAPKLLGQGIAAIADIGITTMADALRLCDVHVSQCGDDVWLEATVCDA
jgi:5-amino-6-(5-phosphoribosylamino)uracil reductase/diaminohydroxyphosphoribosylaminopyrimidine deaminase/5-amino-6-(5-phosphoribosylamino)uracil reductase